MVCGLLGSAALTGAGPAAAAAPAWLPAQGISAAVATAAQIGLGARGDGIAVWQRLVDGGPVVEAAAHPAGGAWTAPAMLGAPGERGRAPAVAVDGAGNALAVYERFDGANWRIAAAERPAASGVWSAPVPISPAGQDARDAHVAFDGSGGALVAWEQSSGLSWVVEAATRPVGADWTAPVQIADAGADVRNLQIAMAGDGRAVIVWERVTGLQSAVQAAVRPPGAGPPPAGQTISESGTSALAPEPVIDGAGNVAVAWQAFDGLRGEAVVIDRPAGAAAWNPPVTVSPADEDAHDVRIGVDAGGGATMLWSRLAAGSWTVRSATRSGVGAPWSAPVSVSPPGGSTVQPGGGLAVDAAGDAVTAFAWQPPGAAQSALLGARRPAGGAWLAPVTVAPQADPAAPLLVGDAAGDAVAVWASGGVLQAAAEDGAPPVLGELTLPSSATAGQQATFSTTAVDAWSGMPGGPLWSFGDGGSAAGAAVGHTYDAPGVYPVTLVGIDAFDNVSRVTQILTVGPPATSPLAPTQEAPQAVAPSLRRVAAIPARLHPVGRPTGCRAPAPVGLPAGRCRSGMGVQIQFFMSGPGPIALAIRPASGGRPLASARVDGRAGLNRVRLTGWARGKPIPSGTYRVTLRPGVPPARGATSSIGVVVSR